MKHVRRVSAASHVFICVPFIRTSFSSVFIYVGLQKREIHVNVVSSRVAGVCRQVEADKCVVRPLCFAGCVKTSLSASSLHDGHVRTSRCKQPPNCNVCSVPLLSSLQAPRMKSLIDCECGMYSPTQLLVFQDTDSVSFLTLC